MRAADPPTDKEVSQLKNEATYSAARLPLTVIPATGLYPSEFFHIHQDWITWPTEDGGQDYPIISVPVKDECKRKTKARGRNKSTVGIVDREEPCSICKRINRDKFQSPSSFEVERQVPVIDKSAVDELWLWFHRYDTIPWNNSLTRLQTISNNLINRCISSYDLRQVFGRRAIKMGISDDIIVENLGLKDKPKWLLEYERRFRPEKTGQLTFQQYLTVINKNSPISVESISELIGRSESAVGNMVRKLEKHDFATRVSQNGKDGQKRDLWDTSVGPDTLLSCPKEECTKKFDTFRGLTAHSTRVH